MPRCACARSKTLCESTVGAVESAGTVELGRAAVEPCAIPNTPRCEIPKTSELYNPGRPEYDRAIAVDPIIVVWSALVTIPVDPKIVVWSALVTIPVDPKIVVWSALVTIQVEP